MSDGDSSASSDGDGGDASNSGGGNAGGPDGNSGESNGNSGGSNGRSDSSDGGPVSPQRAPESAEKALMVVGGLLTFLVLGYLVWHAVTVEPSVPRATVVGTEELSDGRVAVHVVLHVPEGTGLVSATVSSECTSPPTTTSFSNLPADTTWSGTLLCPAGTTDPTVSVSSWVEA